MKELLSIEKLHKTFKLSSKQQKLEHTNSKYKVAVDDISFKAYKGEVFGLLGPNVPRYEQETGSLFRHLQLWRELYT